MNRKQLILLLVIMAVIGAAGLVLLNHNRESWASPEAKMGHKVLPAFQPEKIAAIHVQGAGDLHLVRQNDVWRVRERYDYPANFHQLSDLLFKLKDLKVVESETIGPSQLDRVELNEPGHGAGSGTLVEFQDAEGKVIDSILLGKTHLRQQGENTASPFGAGTPDGRYILLPKEPGDVLLVSNALAMLSPAPQGWLNPGFIKVEKVKSIALDAAWKVSRETDSSPWVLADAKAGETLDPHKINSIASKLAYAKFADVASNLPPSETGLDKPRVITIESFDPLVYTLKIGGRDHGGNYYSTVEVTGDIPASNPKLQEKLKQGRAFAPWIYLLNDWFAQPLLADRAQLFEEKKDEKPTAAPVPADVAPLIIK